MTSRAEQMMTLWTVLLWLLCGLGMAGLYDCLVMSQNRLNTLNQCEDKDITDMAGDALDDLIEGYRMNFKTGDLETLPHKFSKGEITPYLSAVKAAKDMGTPMPGPDYLASMLLMEGRPDFGFDSLNTNNKRAVALRDALVEQGHDPKAAGMAAALMDKQEVAERKGVTLGHAWNGLGRSKHQSGKQYGQKLLRQMQDAIPQPQNNPLFDYINSFFYAQPSGPISRKTGGAIENTTHYRKII